MGALPCFGGRIRSFGGLCLGNMYRPFLGPPSASLGVSALEGCLFFVDLHLEPQAGDHRDGMKKFYGK